MQDIFGASLSSLGMFSLSRLALKPYLPQLFGCMVQKPRKTDHLFRTHGVKMPSRSDTWHDVNLAHAPLLFVRTFNIYRALAYIMHGVYVIYSGVRVTYVYTIIILILHLSVSDVCE